MVGLQIRPLVSGSERGKKVVEGFQCLWVDGSTTLPWPPLQLRLRKSARGRKGDRYRFYFEWIFEKQFSATKRNNNLTTILPPFPWLTLASKVFNYIRTLSKHVKLHHCIFFPSLFQIVVFWWRMPNRRPFISFFVRTVFAKWLVSHVLRLCNVRAQPNFSMDQWHHN